MSNRVFVDTNILVYVLDDSEPKKQLEAARRLEAERETGELVVSTQVLQELYRALTKGPDPIRLPEEAEAAAREAARLIVVQVDVPIILAAIESSRRHSLSLWDALIVEAARSADCARILTEDLNHGQWLGSVRIDNPFMPERPKRPLRRGSRKPWPKAKSQ